MRNLFLILSCLFICVKARGQGCCSGGSGSPIAGGGSQGVLALKQMELATSLQYINDNQFKTQDRDTLPLFDNYNSNYLYSKVAYGVSKDLTFSVEGGYFFNKTQIGLHASDTISSQGWGDLILFPRCNVYSNSNTKRKVEVTLGMGYKIPIGSHTDSTLVFTNPFNGEQFFTTSPPLVQPTNGSHDFIFYGFFLRGFPKHNFRLFANATYIMKGWNSLGEKFGNYKGIGIFASKTFFHKAGVTIQLKSEIIDSMRSAKNTDLLALYNVDTKSTGSMKLMLSPQVNYSFGKLTVFGLYELPLYENVRGTQVVTGTQFTVGISYRFFTTKNPVCDDALFKYQCPMHCEGSGSNQPGKCPVCGMELKKVN